jgi:hypothetical protein
MFKKKAPETKVVKAETQEVYPTITMPYVTDGVMTEVEGTFSPKALNEKSKYIKYEDRYGYFTRNV